MLVLVPVLRLSLVMEWVQVLLTEWVLLLVTEWVQTLVVCIPHTSSGTCGVPSLMSSQLPEYL